MDTVTTIGTLLYIDYHNVNALSPLMTRNNCEKTKIKDLIFLSDFADQGMYIW